MRVTYSTRNRAEALSAVTIALRWPWTFRRWIMTNPVARATALVALRVAFTAASVSPSSDRFKRGRSSDRRRHGRVCRRTRGVRDRRDVHEHRKERRGDQGVQRDGQDGERGEHRGDPER